MAAAIGGIGTRQDINIRVGDALVMPLVAKDATGTVINLTGATLSAKISARDAGVGSETALTVVVTNAVNGALTVEITVAVSNALTATDFFTARPSHNWTLVMTDAAARPQTLFYGIVKVAAKVLQ